MRIKNKVTTIKFNDDEKKVLEQASKILQNIRHGVMDDEATWGDYSIYQLEELSNLFLESSKNGIAEMY